jgi:hypothetical protein
MSIKSKKKRKQLNILSEEVAFRSSITEIPICNINLSVANMNMVGLVKVRRKDGLLVHHSSLSYAF